MNLSAHIFIGADNHTHHVNLARVHVVLDKRHSDGYTLWQSEGRWHGYSEPSAVAMVTGTREHILGTARMLRDELSQDAIGVQFTPAMELV